MSLTRSRRRSGTTAEGNSFLAGLSSLPLLVRALPEPNRAMPCVLGAPSNINSIRLKMEPSAESSRREACWGLGSKGQADTGTRSQSTSQASCKPEGLVSRLTGASWVNGSQDLQDSVPNLPCDVCPSCSTLSHLHSELPAPSIQPTSASHLCLLFLRNNNLPLHIWVAAFLIW